MPSVEEPAPSVAPKPGPRPGGRKKKPGKKVVKKPPKKKTDGLDFFDECGDDPMCGFGKR
jgi:hypothetical protein